MKKKELLKIVKLTGVGDSETAKKIADIAHGLDTSARKVIQYSLVRGMDIRSIPKYPKQYSESRGEHLIKTAFIPFNESLWISCETKLKERNMTFKDAVVRAVEDTYQAFIEKKIDKRSENYKMYIKIEF